MDRNGVRKLLARARPLETLGNAANAPQDKLADLREEAIARLKAYRDKPLADYVPRYLLQMHPEQKYAVVVDTQKARLYLYRNEGGKPRFRFGAGQPVADHFLQTKTCQHVLKNPITFLCRIAALGRQFISQARCRDAVIPV